jgi:AcrR family transcriptional regulator
MHDKSAKARATDRGRAILRVALKVFAKEGFANADVQVIADLAGVGKGTVYRQFGNKEELFLATVKASVEWLAEYVGEAVDLSDSTAEFLRQVARACATYVQKNPQTIEIMIQERAVFRESVFPTAIMYRADSVAALETMIGSAIDRGEFRQTDPTLAMNAFLDLLYGALVYGCLAGGRRTLVERIMGEVEVFLQGLLTRSGDLSSVKKS